ncbi:helix-turn-helix domain-containing protein [Variovorax robiniae]|uniref:Helix-turn-helix domain-containing protein n=1 Tax=Variovorax robiniae TaxID=1836199 RepID=A0ABU8X7W9_9BURK
MQAPTAARYLPIGVVARRTGLAVSALRYYEEVGLLAPAARSDGGHRVYPESAVDVLALIRHCRDLGFSIDDTRELLSLSDNSERDCQDARDIAKSQLAAVRDKMVELRQLERSLARFVHDCDRECAGGPAAQCCIFRDLRKGQTEPAGGSCCAVDQGQGSRPAQAGCAGRVTCC